MNYDKINEQTQHAVIEVDADGYIVAINDQFCELLGYGAELVGQSLAELVPKVMQDAHNMGFSRFVMTGKATVMEQDIQLPTLHATGIEMPLFHHIAASRNAQGEWRIVSMIRELA